MTATGTIGVLRGATRTIGLTLPSGLTARLAEIDTASRATPCPDRGEVARAYTAAVLANRDPATDRAVTTALVRSQLALALTDTALREWSDSARSDALAEHAPAIFDQLGTIVGKAGAELAKALPALDPFRTLDAQAVDALNGGARSAAAWHTAHTSAAVIDQAITCQVVLLHDVLHDVVAFMRVLLAVPTVAHADLGGFSGIPEGVTPWALTAEHKVTITGASLDEYRDAHDRVALEADVAAAVPDRSRGFAVPLNAAAAAHAALL